MLKNKKFANNGKLLDIKHFTGQCINIIELYIQVHRDDTEKNIDKKGLYVPCLFGAQTQFERKSREGKEQKDNTNRRKLTMRLVTTYFPYVMFAEDYLLDPSPTAKVT